MIKHLSASAITTYLNCPIEFKFKYIDRFLEPETKALRIGKWVHLGIETYNNGKDWQKVLKHEILIDQNKDTIATFRLVRRCTQSYIDNPVQGTTIGNEVRFKENLEGIDVPILGFIDRLIEDGIVEYKTTSEDYTQEKVDTSLQGDIYWWAATKKLGKSPKKIIYWVVNKNGVMKSDAYKPQIITTKRTEAQIETMKKTVIDVYGKIIKEDYTMPETHQIAECYFCRSHYEYIKHNF